MTDPDPSELPFQERREIVSQGRWVRSADAPLEVPPLVAEVPEVQDEEDEEAEEFVEPAAEAPATPQEAESREDGQGAEEEALMEEIGVEESKEEPPGVSADEPRELAAEAPGTPPRSVLLLPPTMFTPRVQEASTTATVPTVVAQNLVSAWTPRSPSVVASEAERTIRDAVAASSPHYRRTHVREVLAKIPGHHRPLRDWTNVPRADAGKPRGTSVVTALDSGSLTNTGAFEGDSPRSETLRRFEEAEAATAEAAAADAAAEAGVEAAEPKSAAEAAPEAAPEPAAAPLQVVEEVVAPPPPANVATRAESDVAPEAPDATAPPPPLLPRHSAPRRGLRGKIGRAKTRGDAEDGPDYALVNALLKKLF